MAGSYDWSRFTKRVSIHADAQHIYDSWVSQEGLKKWFLRVAEFSTPDNVLRDKKSSVRPGDLYRWLWFGYSDDVVEHGRILQANGKDFLQFTFTAQCVVSVNIKQEQGEMICSLMQENIPTDEKGKIEYHMGCMNGWTFYLANLKSVLEDGIDLRNKNQSLSDVINA